MSSVSVVTLVSLLVIGGVVFKTLSAEERLRIVKSAVRRVLRAKDYGRKELAPFREALRSRTHWPIVTIALAALNVVIYLRMAFGPGAVGDPATLVAWGASLGPRTTNGEWWRLMTAMFVNAGFLAVLMNTAALAQVGLMLERLVGPFAFAATYLTAAIFGGFASLSMNPIAVSSGASAAVFGLYGLLITTLVCGWWHQSSVTIPIMALKRLAPMTALYVFYAAVDTSVPTPAEFIGFAMGLIFGVVAARDVSDHVPSPRSVTRVLAATALSALIMAIPLRGIADFQPEVQRLVEVERRATDTYTAALERSRKEKLKGTELADVIDQQIVPEFEAADNRLKSFRGLTHDDAARMVDAREYLRLRTESWKLRAQSLRAVSVSQRSVATAALDRARAEADYKSTLRTMGKAEGAERASLQVLDRLAHP